MFPNVNPKQLEQAMKKLGVKQEEIVASEVIIKGAEKNFVITNPHVVRVNMMGQESFQISGDIHEESGVSVEDVATVAAQAGVSRAEAEKALEVAGGNLAEAILSLQQKGA